MEHTSLSLSLLKQQHETVRGDAKLRNRQRLIPMSQRTRTTPNYISDGTCAEATALEERELASCQAVTVPRSQERQRIMRKTMITRKTTNHGWRAAAAVAASATSAKEMMAVVPYTTCGAPQGKG